MSYRILILTIFGLILSCGQSPEKLTDSKDYQQYLEAGISSNLDLLNESKLFWEGKLAENPAQFPYHMKVAGVYNQLFNLEAKISHLIQAENRLISANQATNFENASYLRALAHNYISQHRFKEALMYLEKAEINGENLRATQKMKFDVLMELGNYDIAKLYLDKIEDLSDFDYLIRVAKWSDHQGNLDAAIKYMEKAGDIAQESGLPSNKKWTYTNLADYYGHAGRIGDSYNHYLKALELDPNDAYAKKGIAWIVFSYERNPDEAYRILTEISNDYDSPDIQMLMSEIAAYKGDSSLAEKHLNRYAESIEDNYYGEMYNISKAEMYAENDRTRGIALELAEKEVNNRPTPSSYSLLAFTYYKNGNLDKALEIIQSKVEGKTFEPRALYHIAEVYAAAGYEEKTEELKEELITSIFELGPTMEPKIHQLML